MIRPQRARLRVYDQDNASPTGRSGDGKGARGEPRRQCSPGQSRLEAARSGRVEIERPAAPTTSAGSSKHGLVGSTWPSSPGQHELGTLASSHGFTSSAPPSTPSQSPRPWTARSILPRGTSLPARRSERRQGRPDDGGRTVAVDHRRLRLVNAEARPWWGQPRARVPVPDRVAGIDLFNGIVERAAQTRHRVYFLGATEDVSEMVAPSARTIRALSSPGPRRVLGRRRRRGRDVRQAKPRSSSSPSPAPARSIG